MDVVVVVVVVVVAVGPGSDLMRRRRRASVSLTKSVARLRRRWLKQLPERRSVTRHPRRQHCITLSRIHIGIVADKLL
jgi:hypothetical protein